MDITKKLRAWKADRMIFRKEAILLEDGRTFGEAIEPWQEDDFKALDSGRYRHAYLERPRGHSKTGDVGTEAVTELVLGSPGQKLFCCAADEEQARLLFDDVSGKFNRSPLLRGSVKITQREITMKATGSKLRVLASDAPSAYGLRPDFIIIDELAEWTKRELWDSLWSATGKRQTCRVLVISSAGWDRTSIAWEVRQIAESEADWHFSSRGQCASWIKPSWLDQQRRTLPAHVFARLHENRWVEGVGAFLTAEEVDRIFTDSTPEGEEQVSIGLDLGLAKDRSVLSLLRKTKDGLIVVEAIFSWQGTTGQKVSLEDVEEETYQLAGRFNCPVILDPWQGILLSQRLQSRGIDVVEYSFTSENRRRLFSVLLDLIRNGRLKSRPHDDFRRELLGLEAQETPSGYRVDHRPGRHDDHVVSVGLAAQALAGEPQGHGFGVMQFVHDQAEEVRRKRAKVMTEPVKTGGERHWWRGY